MHFSCRCFFPSMSVFEFSYSHVCLWQPRLQEACPFIPSRINVYARTSLGVHSACARMCPPSFSSQVLEHGGLGTQALLVPMCNMDLQSLRLAFRTRLARASHPAMSAADHSAHLHLLRIQSRESAHRICPSTAPAVCNTPTPTDPLLSGPTDSLCPPCTTARLCSAVCPLVYRFH